MSLVFSETCTLPKGEVVCDQFGGDVWLSRLGLLGGDFLTINAAEHTVKWYGPGGSQLKRVYDVNKLPMIALFCYLKVTVGEEVSPNGGQRRLALAVLTDEDMLHIFTESGEHFDITLPSVVHRMVSTPFGLILQSQESYDTFDLLMPPSDNTLLSFAPNSPFQSTSKQFPRTNSCKLFSLSSPYASIRIISSDIDRFADSVLLGVYESLVFMLLTTSNKIGVFSVSEAESKDQLLFSEDERRRSIEYSMNQSSFLDKSALSHSKGSASSGMSARSTNSLNSSGTGSITQTKKKPGKLRLSLSPNNQSPQSEQSARDDSNRLQNIILGPNQSIFTKAVERNLAGNIPMSSSARVPIVSPQFKSMTDISGLSGFDMEFSEIPMTSFHNETYFQVSSELHFTLKSTASLSWDGGILEHEHWQCCFSGKLDSQVRTSCVCSSQPFLC
jgi:hypothetical protein